MFSTGKIAATKSHGERSYVYIENRDPEAVHDGTLTVTEIKGKRVVRTISSRYLIQEEPPIGVQGRKFLVVKDSHSGDADTVAGVSAANRVSSVYQCVIGNTASHDTCTCDAGNVRRFACLHTLALRDLIEQGGLENPMERPQ